MTVRYIKQLVFQNSFRIQRTNYHFNIGIKQRVNTKVTLVIIYLCIVEYTWHSPQHNQAKIKVLFSQKS